MLQSSVDILKEIAEKVEKPKYFHDVNLSDTEGENEVTCKLVKLEGVLVLERALSTHFTKQSLEVLDKILYSLDTGDKILMSEKELRELTRLVSTVYGLEDLDKVVMFVRGYSYNGNFGESDVEEWKDKIEDILNRENKLIDHSKKYLKATFDDGLNDFRVIVSVNFTEKEGIEVGDIVRIVLADSHFNSYNGYLVACTNMDTLMGFKDINKIGK